MKKTSIVLLVLTLVICFMMYACDGAEAGKVKDTTQGLDLTTTHNITTAEQTTTGATHAPTSAADTSSTAAGAVSDPSGAGSSTTAVR